tara:strand:+ start:952 stop:1302 length:351 start_codon:yes stop_codon:yes gene_type:complete
MVKKSNKKDKSGYCVLFISHRGIGRRIVKTDDMQNYKKKDIWGDYIVCDKDLKKAKQKLKIKMDKAKEKERKKKENETPAQKLKKEEAKKERARIRAKKRYENQKKRREGRWIRKV